MFKLTYCGNVYHYETINEVFKVLHKEGDPKCNEIEDAVRNPGVVNISDWIGCLCTIEKE